MENETWKNIPNYEEYQISSFGRLKQKNGRIRETGTKFRYPTYTLYKGNHKKTMAIHKLVADLFLGKSPCCPTCGSIMEINHKDENKSNNRVDNLEYVTHKENLNKSNEKRRIGLIKRFSK